VEGDRKRERKGGQKGGEKKRGKKKEEGMGRKKVAPSLPLHQFEQLGLKCRTTLFSLWTLGETERRYEITITHISKNLLRDRGRRSVR